MKPTRYSKALGKRLRAVRTSQGMSLNDVYDVSGGTWHPAVIGSYERGQRAVSVEKLTELAAFYDVDVAVLLPGRGRRRAARAPLPLLDEFPGELSLSQDFHGRWVLVMAGPYLSGAASSASRECVIAVAETYVAMRREQEREAAA